MGVFPAHISVYNMVAVPMEDRFTGSDSLGQELQKVVISHVSSGDLPWVVWKSSQCP